MATRATALALLVLVPVACVHDDSAIESERYRYDPGQIAQQWGRGNVVKPPPISAREVWTTESLRGHFRNLKDPSRIVIYCEERYDDQRHDPLTYLDSLRKQVWLDHNWGDVPAHYYVADTGKGGLIFEGRREFVAAESKDGRLDQALVISTLGCFDARPPERRTMEAVSQLAAYLCDKYRIPPENVVSRTALGIGPGQPGPFLENYFRNGWLVNDVRDRIERAYKASPRG